MHVGGIRTALYNYLFARHHGGQLIVRIEDTDQERSLAEHATEQLNDLTWLGIQWDEGPDKPGDVGPYYQSQRLDIYSHYIQMLLASGHAYYCFLTDDEIEAQKEQAEAAGEPYQISSPYRDYAFDDPIVTKRLAQGEKATVRFKVVDREKVYTVHDLVRDDIQLPAHMVGDFVLMRSDGMPVYNFSCVIDDHLMAISHVFRGEEHLSNSLRQLMLYEAFDFEPPQFGHLSIILDEARKKLSKRHQAASCADLKKLGYVPEGILNYLALLGWSHPKGEEILSKAELIEAFSIDRVNASPAVFDIQKLHWLNGQHLREMDDKALWTLIMGHADATQLALPSTPQWYAKAIPVIRSECYTLQDGAFYLKQWFDQNYFTLKDDAKEVLSWPTSKGVISQWLALIEKKAPFITKEQYNDIANKIKEAVDVKGKALFMPLRVAMVGQPHGPDLHLLVEALPVSLIIQRANMCLNHA